MNRLNRKIEYALMALKVMAQKRPGELTSVKEVVDATGCPFDATARVLQLLTQEGVLRSEHGAHGGYQLLRDLNKVTLLEVWQIVLGPLALAKCLHGTSTCELEGTCNIMSPINSLNRRLYDFYQGISLGELLQGRERTAIERAEASL